MNSAQGDRGILVRGASEQEGAAVGLWIDLRPHPTLSGTGCSWGCLPRKGPMSQCRWIWGVTHFRFDQWRWEQVREVEARHQLPSSLCSLSKILVVGMSFLSESGFLEAGTMGIDREGRKIVANV